MLDKFKTAGARAVNNYQWQKYKQFQCRRKKKMGFTKSKYLEIILTQEQ